MRCAPPSAAAPRSAALALPRLALLLLALAAPLAHAQILCASNLTTTVAASNIGSVSLAKDASGYPLPSVALAGGETVVVCSNSTGTFAVQSLNFGISFLAPVLIRRATTAVGIISDGSRFDAIGNIGGVLGSMTLVGTVWLVNATNPNLTDVKVIAPVAPTKFKMVRAAVPACADPPDSRALQTGKAGLFVVAADGGSVSQLSIWTRNSQNISGKWIARSCPSCTATTLTPSLASDGYGVLVCGATGTLTKVGCKLCGQGGLMCAQCFLSSDGVATYAQTATSPANTLSDFAVASSGSQGFFLFAYASANKLQTQYTTDGGTTWSSPIAAMAAPTIAPGAFQLLALADNHYVLTLGGSARSPEWGLTPASPQAWPRAGSWRRD
jgi:hypothetical protein